MTDSPNSHINNFFGKLKKVAFHSKEDHEEASEFLPKKLGLSKKPIIEASKHTEANGKSSFELMIGDLENNIEKIRHNIYKEVCRDFDSNVGWDEFVESLDEAYQIEVYERNQKENHTQSN